MHELTIIRGRLYCRSRCLGSGSFESVFVRVVILIDVGTTLAGRPGGGGAVVLLVAVEAVVVCAGDGVGDADDAVTRVSWELKNGMKVCDIYIF